MGATREERLLSRTPAAQAGLVVVVALVNITPTAYNVYAELTLMVASPLALGVALLWPLRLRSRLPHQSPERDWRPAAVAMQALTAVAWFVSMAFSGLVVYFMFWWPDI